MSTILIGKYQSSIYPEGNGYTGAIDLGFDGTGKRQRIKRKGRTKAAVKDKLIKVVHDRESGVKTSKDTENYTVEQAMTDWLSKGLKDLGPGTVSGYRILAGQHVLPLIGATKLKELSADDVNDWLDGLTGKLSTRSLQTVHWTLKRAIRQAQARDRVPGSAMTGSRSTCGARFALTATPRPRSRGGRSKSPRKSPRLSGRCTSTRRPSG